jgi:Outer membrane protein beta-barrel domain
MQITKFLVFLGLSLAAMPLTQATDGRYVRFSAARFVPDGDNYQNADGAMVAFGTTLDLAYTDNASLIELELGGAQWDYDDTAVIDGTTYTGDAELTFVPILLTYRYELALDPALKIAVGPSVGVSYFEGAGSIDDGTTSESIADHDWVFTYGLSVQVALVLSETISLNAGYHVLVNGDASFNVSGRDLPVTDLNTQIFQVGIRFDWPL